MDYRKNDEEISWKDQLPAILSPADIMDILGIGKNSVYKLLLSGKLKGIRIGRNWRITWDAVEEFLLLK